MSQRKTCEQGWAHRTSKGLPKPSSQADFMLGPLTGGGRAVQKFTRSLPVPTKGN